MFGKKTVIVLFTVTLFAVALLTSAPFVLEAGSFDLNIIDVPKAYTPYRGDMNFGFSVYDGGGIFTSAVLGVSDFVFLGIYFDMGRFIGSDTVDLSQPGVIARFLITDGSKTLPAIAVGYSYFMRGELSKVDGTIVNGAYIVASNSYYLFRNEQNLSYGLRYPIVPFSYSKPENLTVFVGTDIELSPQFSFKGEIEDIRIAQGRWDEVWYNFGVNFNIVDLVSIDLEFKYSHSIDRLVRHLTIGYFTQF